MSTSRFLDNDFAVLGVFPRSTLAQIVEASENPVLKASPERVSAARSALCHPRSRLAAELAWLPGLAPSRTGEVLYVLAGGGDAEAACAGAPPLARLNIAVAALHGLSREPVSKAKARLAAIFDLYGQIEPESLLRDINADRAVAGVSAAQAGLAFDQALDERSTEIAADVLDYLDRLDPDTLIAAMTDVTAQRTQSGTQYGGPLLAKILAKYEIELTGFLGAEAEKIVRLSKTIAENGAKEASHLAPASARVAKMLSRWATIAQPLAMWRMSQGQVFEPTESLLGQVRLASLALYNEHEQLAAVIQMTRALSDASKYCPEWRSIFERDLNFLEAQTKGTQSKRAP